MNAGDVRARGAYGLAFAGPLAESADERWLPLGAPVASPLIVVRDRHPADEDGHGTVRVRPLREGRALLHEDGTVLIDRGFPTPPDMVPHPTCAAAAMVANPVPGRAWLHAGGLVVDGRVWALVADREGGKSTLLTTAHLLGACVHTDDTFALDADGTVPPGPRCIDLRPPGAAALDVPTETVRRGERERVTLPDHGPEPLPVAGLVLLERAEDGDAPALTDVPVADRLGRLAGQADLREVSRERLLEFLALDVVTFRRPFDHDRRDAGVTQLLHELAGR